MIQALVWTHFFRSSCDTRLISALMCPFQAISFLSLHASFPSFFDLVEKKTVVANYAATGYEYREMKATSMRKIHAIVIFVTYIRVHFLFI
ncbi:conserved hypothetical protein [Klebsiella quasipneumoniae subsp. similipneumoniae]|nr:conserved hypothetical protein [Klebsiella quasipneumoniae subsp. similipneumoniae]